MGWVYGGRGESSTSEMSKDSSQRHQNGTTASVYGFKRECCRADRILGECFARPGHVPCKEEPKKSQSQNCSGSRCLHPRAKHVTPVASQRNHHGSVEASSDFLFCVVGPHGADDRWSVTSLASCLSFHYGSLPGNSVVH